MGYDFLYGVAMEYILKRSKRKTVSLQINKDLTVEVRAPIKLSKAEIEKFVLSHTKWIEKHKVIMAQRNSRRELTDGQITELKERAREYILPRVEHFSDMLQLYPKSVKITKAQTRFGSCSAKNAICFSCYLMLYEPAAIDYVIVHELAHIRHHNHSREFYSLIERYMPDYKARRELLRVKNNGENRFG